MKVLQPPAKDSRRALTLERLTLTYVAAEDRMRLVGLGKDGDAIVLWLTQRLCNQMVRTLTGFLEKLAEERGMLAKDAVLSFQQSAARAGQRSLPPVTAGPDAAQALVRGIEVRQSAKRFVLTFRFGKEARAEVALAVPGLHRWLLALHGRYLKAGWTMQTWPDWFEAPTAEPAAGPSALH